VLTLWFQRELATRYVYFSPLLSLQTSVLNLIGVPCEYYVASALIQYWLLTVV